jgi:hypothetical protein
MYSEDQGVGSNIEKLTLNDGFYVVDLAYTHVVKIFEWLYSLGDICMNYKDMRIEFWDKGGQ